ncbi:MAG TPA: chorismate-binding protein, partial [Hyphomicrobiaceae bacterium]|nr:chorismate-binding protein [Hyphomicrobiaceae bacterium]
MTKLEPVGRDLEVDPPRGEFARRYAAGQPQVVWTRLIADLETPVSAMLKLSDGQPLSCLLESVQGGATRGRYSIIGLAPDLVWRAFANRAEVNERPLAAPAAFRPETAPTLQSLRALLAASRIELPAELPPIAAGIIGYMGYDTVRLIEHLPHEKPDTLGVPDAVFVRPTVMVVFDTIKDEMAVVTPVRPAPGIDAGAAYAAAIGRLKGVLAALDAPLPHATNMSGIDLALPDAVSNTSPAEFKAMVQRGKEYIAAGDVFQVVLSQRFDAPFALPPLALYRALRRTNPSPFLFHLDFGGFALVGSSPEILVRVRDGEVTIRPLAG